ncbi:MAG: cation efflux family transporter [Deltaproteobacteria bacterium]|nr:MAG: cation efflux family transporter [Deltaproteobacteria bacterium]
MGSENKHGSTRAIFYALGANLGIAAAKTAGAIITNSGAMLAEAVHSFADCANQLLLFIGISRAKRPPDSRHPLGYGKTIYFWSFIVALMLFSMGGLFSLYEGAHKLAAIQRGGDHSIESPWVAIVILLFGVALEGSSLLGALKESRELRRGKTLWRWFKSSRESTYLVVIGEDFAALIGLTLALMAVGLSVVTGNPLYDALGSMAVGALLIVVAIVVGIEIKSLLIGESAGSEVEEAIRVFLNEHSAVDKLLNLKTLQMGDEVMVAVKALMSKQESVDMLISEINRCERELKSAFPQVRWIFFEPDNCD